MDVTEEILQHSDQTIHNQLQEVMLKGISSEEMIDSGIQSQLSICDITPLNSQTAGAQSEDEDDQLFFNLAKKKRKRVALNYSDDSDMDESSVVYPVTCDPNTTTNTVLPILDKNTENNVSNCDIDHINEQNQGDLEKHDTTSSLLLHNSDVFDSEINSDDELSREYESSNEENPEIEMSTALKKRLSKGASKKQASSRKSQASEKDNIIQLHSETQRLVRESSLRIPYHKPEKLDLSVFLARTQKKQQQLASTPGSKVNSLPSWKQLPNSLKKFVVFDKKDPSPNSLIDRLVKAGQDVSGIASDPIANDQIQKLGSKQKDDDDDLPDLFVDTKHHCDELNRVNSLLEDIICNDSNKISSLNDVHIDNEVVVNEPNILSNVTKESVDHLNTQQMDSSLQLCTSDVVNIAKISNTEMQIQTLLVNHYPSSNSPPPKLSSGTNSYIDLDDETSTSSATDGINSLMNRLIKHSHSKNNKKSRNVEISTISKEKLDENREELKMKKMVYKIEGDEEPEHNTPGAKLIMLKKKKVPTATLR